MISIKKGTTIAVPLSWLREPDSNRRPLGYEPNELPLLHPAMFVSAKVRIIFISASFLGEKIIKK